MDCHEREPDRGHPLCLNDPTGTMGRIMGRYGTPRGRQIGLWERPLSHMIWPNRWLFLSLGWWMLISIRGDLKRRVFFQPPPQSYRCRILIWLPWCKEMLYVRCIWGLKSILKFIIYTLTFLTWLPLTKNISRPTKMFMNYNLHNKWHFLLVQVHFPSVANSLKLISCRCCLSISSIMLNVSHPSLQYFIS